LKARTFFLGQPLRCLVAAACLSALPCLPAQAELVLVVNVRSSIQQLTREEVINIFMGRYRKAPNDTTILPLDQEGDAAARRLFYRELINKSLEEVNAYWARLVFAGRTVPPMPVKGTPELLDKLVNDPNAIGYVERNVLNSPEGSSRAKNLRVVFSLPG
jgi:ABC-type phosphate transport system substrate-binding protein